MKDPMKINWSGILWYAVLGAAVGTLLAINLALFSMLIGLAYPLKFSTIAENLIFISTAVGAGYGACYRI